MRDPLRVRLADIIDQARAKAPADLVIKSVGILDLTSASDGGRYRGRRGSHRRHHDTYKGATEVDGRGLRPCRLHRQPRPLRIHVYRPWSSTAASCRAARRRRLRSARDLQRAGHPGAEVLLECAAVTVMDLRVQLSSCVPATHLETFGRALEAKDLLPFKHHPKVLGSPSS